jgi:hypothetical protein
MTSSLLHSDLILNYRWSHWGHPKGDANAAQPTILTQSEGIAAIAKNLDLKAGEIWVGTALLDAVVGAFSSAGHFVMVAEPVCHNVLEAIAATGGRYVDVGRNAEFQVDLPGWRALVQDDRSSLAYLAQPEEPTGSMPSAQCIAMAQSNNVPVLSDERFGGPRLPTAVQSGVLRLSLLTPPALGKPCVECLTGPAELISRVAQVAPRGTSFAWNLAMEPQLRANHQRFAEQQSLLYADLLTVEGLQVSPPHACGIWARIPGQLSQQSADRADHKAVIGSNAWTWRDGVWLAPLPSQQNADLLDALRRAL